MKLRIQALAGVVLAAAMLAFVWIHHDGAPVGAHEPHPGLNFSIAVAGAPGCDTTRGDATCTLDPGSTFTVQVSLDRLPSDIPQYEGFDVFIRYSGVTPQQDGSADAWPDCGFPAQFYGDDYLAIGCAVGIPPAGPSTYTGVIATNSFTCTRSGTITLVHGTDERGVTNTDLVDPSGLAHAEGTNARETLRIDCGQGLPPPPTPPLPGVPAPPGLDLTPGAASPAAPTPTRLPPTEEARATATAEAVAAATGEATVGGPGGEEEEGGGLSPAVWAIIGVVAAAAVVVAGSLGWRYYRSRQQQT